MFSHHGLTSSSPPSWHVNLDATKLYTVAQLAAAVSVSRDSIRRIFVDERGVLIITRHRKGTRIYRTLRIPGAIAIAKFESFMNGGQS